MEGKDLVDWVISKDTREILLVVAIIGSCIFLLYGIFNGRPPLLKETELDEKGRKISLFLGFAFLGVFFLTLTIPLFYDIFLIDKYEVVIGNDPAREGTRFLAIDNEGNRLPGDLSIKREGKSESKAVLSLPSYGDEVKTYKSPLKIFGKKAGEYREIAAGGEDRVYVSDNWGKVRGPIRITDANGNVVKEIPTFNWGAIVVPDNSRVEFYNAALLYRDEKGELEKKWIGSRIDPDKWDYGKDENLLIDWQEPRTIDILMISDRLAGGTMKSGVRYDPDLLVGSSKIFPLGTELLVSNPLVKGRPIRVIIQDKSKEGRLVLSSGAFKELEFTLAGKPQADVQVVDYHQKRPRKKTSQNPIQSD
ncbi:septal ring lytic transglycosylase RlpA family protein [Marinobacter nauticus]|uniref:septal ring lytic transglycosylase RlpA family protein n=1 Tax=Marinobacter nauticus TaxID=2743 RepID=UPI001D18A85E|nr:septal ring lytic transglycosylase RlpA family protein [Marinobacter nauticus]MCC4270122.1 septal ring lytic transglycosylase RlpA family protein [Marinobacter nauticus]